MGYRNYIAPISKQEHNKIKDFCKEELFNYKEEPFKDEWGDPNYIGVYDIPGKPLYGLGKYVEDFDQSLFSPVFANERLQKYFSEEHDFYLVGKEFLEAVIERYSEKIRSYYKEMTSPFFKDNRPISDFINSVTTDYDREPYQHNFDFSLITEKEKTALFSVIEHIRTMSLEWGACGDQKFFDSRRPYSLDNRPEITISSKYEYAQFELVRIYKTFDWENNHLIYYGY